MLKTCRAFLMLSGLALLLVSWAMSNPPGAMSDEPDQYIRALGAASGQIVGQPVTAEQAASADPGLSGIRQVLGPYAAQDRAFTIPADLDPGAMGCSLSRRGSRQPV